MLNVQKVKEEAIAVKAASELQVAARKAKYYAGIATDKEVADFFAAEAQKLTAAARTFQQCCQNLAME